MNDNLKDITANDDVSSSVEIGDYVVNNSVEAVRLDGSMDIARVGRWITDNGGVCSWVAASGVMALVKTGEDANRLWVHRYRDTGGSKMAGIGDWVVHVAGKEFLVVGDENFTDTYAAQQEIQS